MQRLFLGLHISVVIFPEALRRSMLYSQPKSAEVYGNPRSDIRYNQLSKYDKRLSFSLWLIAYIIRDVKTDMTSQCLYVSRSFDHVTLSHVPAKPKPQYPER